MLECIVRMALARWLCGLVGGNEYRIPRRIQSLFLVPLKNSKYRTRSSEFLHKNKYCISKAFLLLSM